MKKVFVFIVIIAFFAAFFLSEAFASDVSKTKRHIAMVYDDSTSMYVSDSTQKPVLNWSYANYMTQAFLALLNPQDSLFITYMSDKEKENVKYSNLLESDREQAIANIRTKNDFINETPFEAVETAYSMLKNLDEDRSDEYWLVIATDGAFTYYEDDVYETLLGYIEEMAALGKTLKVVFLAIGDEASPPEQNLDAGLLVYETGLDEIVSTMSKLADNISGRHNVQSSRMSELSGNRLSVDMLLPVRSLIVFTQADGNTLLDIENSKSEEMILTYSYDIKAPDPIEYEKDEMLTDKSAVGTISKVAPKEEGVILSDGRYTLAFSNEVNIENIRVMYEPALDITVRYMQNGRVVQNPEDGSKCDIEVVLTNALTGNALNSSVLPEDVECTIQVLSGGAVVDIVDGFIAKDIVLKSEETVINTEISMPGYFTLRNRQDYVYQTQPEATPAPTPVGYDESQGPWPPEVELLVQMPEGGSIDLKDLEEISPFIVIPTFNGEKGEVSDLNLGSLELFCSRNIEFEVTVDETVPAYLIAPKYSGDIYSTSTGAVSVNIIFQSEYGKTAASAIVFNVNGLTWFERNKRVILVPFAAAVVAVIILGILVFRKKFAKGTWLELTQMQQNMADDWVAVKTPASVSLNNLKGRWRMIPFAPERITISGLDFYPTNDDQYVIISKKSLKPNMGTSRGFLEEDELKANYYLQNGFKFFIENGKDRFVFVYHAPKRTLLINTKKRKKH